jgi:urocanate hydratase
MDSKARTVCAARRQRHQSCANWLKLKRFWCMLQNNLIHAETHELVVYGGIGKAARNRPWCLMRDC